jgi:hypothetical protein
MQKYIKNIIIIIIFLIIIIIIQIILIKYNIDSIILC